MTLLVSWVGIDTHGASSLYIVSDSRISWGDKTRFEYGRKVFAFSKWPDILGYSGDVLFPSIVINQIIELGDAGLLFLEKYSCKEKFQAIVKKLNDQFAQYPKLVSKLEENKISIIHASRDNSDKNKVFCHKLSWTKAHGWKGEEINVAGKSRVLFVLGCGANEFEINYKRYENGQNAGTSRNVFHCFCDTLKNTTDPFVGGAPQLVGIYRKPGSSAMNFGVLYQGARHFLGAKVDNVATFDTVEWRNENFERCDGNTTKKLANAQSQPDPLRRL